MFFPAALINVLFKCNHWKTLLGRLISLKWLHVCSDTSKQERKVALEFISTLATKQQYYYDGKLPLKQLLELTWAGTSIKAKEIQIFQT